MDINDNFSIFTNAMNTLSTPQASYLFEVDFLSTDGLGDQTGVISRIRTNKEAVAIKSTLPKAEIKTVTRWFAGTPKTDAINTICAGDTQMEFIVRSEGLGDLKNLLYSALPNWGPDDSVSYSHKEHFRQFDRIQINLLTNTNKTKAQSMGSNCANTHFVLYNCNITNVDFGDVSYEDNSYVKCNVTVHYDWWREF